jgi:SRSO17 transposase
MIDVLLQGSLLSNSGDFHPHGVDVLSVPLGIFIRRSHMKRSPAPTVSIIDLYCSAYNDLFSDVRSYECFKYLHQGIISPIKRKSLPEIAKVVGVSSSQSLHHFLAHSPWSVKGLRERRLALTLKALKEQKIKLVIDETGDRKKGKKTDYVARQYLGSVLKDS